MMGSTNGMTHVATPERPMNSRHHSYSSPISDDFFTYGNEGIGLHHIEERRAAERERNRLAGGRPRSIGAFRRRLGALLIAAGQDLRGDCVPVPKTAGLRG